MSVMILTKRFHGFLIWFNLLRVISSFTFCPNSKASVAQCGLSSGVQRRILEGNGENGGRHEFPWLVSMQSRIKSGEFPPPNQDVFKEWTHHCGAVILNERYIITAAHCDFHFEAHKKEGILLEMSVVYGSNSLHDMDKSGNRTLIKSTPDGPSRVVPTKGDVAIMELAEDLPIDSVPPYFVNGVCLPPFEDVVGPVVIAGWGTINPWEYTFPDVVKKVKYSKLVHDEGDFLTTEGGPWFGDSGSPLIQYQNGRAYLVGVAYGVEVPNIKWGDEIPDVYNTSYVKIYSIVDWINQYAII